MAAASRLATLIRLRRFALDEARRALGEQIAVRARLAAEDERLSVELAIESAKAGDDPETARVYPAYARRVAAQRHDLATVTALAEQAVAAREVAVAEAYRELRKIEIADELRATARAQEADRREQSRIDEMALGIYRRRQDAD